MVGKAMSTAEIIDWAKKEVEKLLDQKGLTLVDRKAIEAFQTELHVDAWHPSVTCKFVCEMLDTLVESKSAKNFGYKLLGTLVHARYTTHANRSVRSY